MNWEGNSLSREQLGERGWFGSVGLMGDCLSCTESFCFDFEWDLAVGSHYPHLPGDPARKCRREGSESGPDSSS